MRHREARDVRSGAERPVRLRSGSAVVKRSARRVYRPARRDAGEARDVGARVRNARGTDEPGT